MIMFDITPGEEEAIDPKKLGEALNSLQEVFCLTSEEVSGVDSVE